MIWLWDVYDFRGNFKQSHDTEQLAADWIDKQVNPSEFYKEESKTNCREE